MYFQKIKCFYGLVIVISKLRKCHSKAKRRAPAYSRGGE